MVPSSYCSHGVRQKSPKNQTFVSPHFWVQVHGLPIQYQTEKNGFEIGDTFLGKFISVDRNSLGCGGSGGTGEIVWRKFIRIRVVLDVGMPLRTGFWLRRNGMPNIWIFFKYEKLGLFCYKCGRFGHAQRVCNNPARSINFGPWLYAVSVGNGCPEQNSSCSRAGPSVVNRIRDMRVSRDPVSVSPDCLVESPVNMSLMMELCPEMENANEHHQAVDIPRRYLWGKFLINGIDTMAMVMNTMIICMRVTYANVFEPNWRLFLMMAGYLIYMGFKLSREIRQSWYLRARNVRVPLTELSIRALVEVFILIILFLILFSA